MSVQIDSLEIEVKSKAEAAAKGIKELKGALGNLRDVTNSTSQNLKTLNSHLSTTATYLKGFGRTGISKDLAEIKTTLSKLSQETSKVSSNFSALASESAKPLSDVKEEVKETKTEIDDFEEAVKKVRQEKIGDSIKKLLLPLRVAGNFLKKITTSFVRIGFYRAIRFAWSEIVKSIKEGVINVYKFTKVFGGDFATKMDSLKSTFSQFKNQIGSAASEVIKKFEPIIEQALSKLIQFADILSQVFAFMNGEDTYLKANPVAENWIEAEEAAKDYKKQLLGIDEINNLTTNSGSGSGYGNDYSRLFTETPINREAVDSALSKFREILDKVETVAKIIGATVLLFQTFKLSSGLLDIINLFKSGAFSKLFEMVKNPLKITLSVAGFALQYSGVKSWAKDGSSLGALGSIIGSALGVGGMLSLVGAKSLLFTIPISLGLSLLAIKAAGGVNASTLNEMIVTALGEICGGLIGFSLGGAKGAMIGMSIGGVVTFSLEKLIEIKTNNKNMSENTLSMLFNDALYALTGGLIAYRIGGHGVKGAILGMVIGAYVSYALEKVTDAKADGKASAGEVFDILKPALWAVTGGLFGFWFTKSAKGAQIGAEIGMSLKIIFDAIDFESGVAKVEDKLDAWLYEKFGWRLGTDPFRDYEKNPVKKYATGGFPTTGQLFLARENGAEMVGNIGNKTAVANNDQITSAIAAATYNAMSQALSENNGTVVLQVEGDPAGMFKVMQKQANTYTRRTGNPAFN